MSDAIPDDADLQRLESLRADLKTAVDRAVSAGAKPVDVITCVGMVLGSLTHHMKPPLPDAVLGSTLVRLVVAGRQEEAERLVTSGLKHQIVYGGAAGRRRRR